MLILSKFKLNGFNFYFALFGRFSVALKKAGGLRLFHVEIERINLFAAGVFGNGFGALADGMLGQFTWQQQSNASLDFARRDGRSAVQESQSRSLGCNALEYVIHERVHYTHGL